MRRQRLLRLEASLAAAVTAGLDQFCKVLVKAHLGNAGPLPLIKGVLLLNYTENAGAAFGLFKDSRFVLTALSFLILLAAMLFSARIPLQSRGISLALGAGIGGALSNLLDRISRGYVVDFIDFRIWPVFNLADVAIVVGLGFACYGLFFRQAALEKEEK